MSQGPTRRFPSWSLLGHTALFPASIAWLVDSKGKCPFPGLPLSVKVSKPGSPVRSLGCRVMVHPLRSPIRLLPSEVTVPLQSCPVAPALFLAIIVFCMSTAPLPPIPPPLPDPNAIALFSASVLLVRSTMPQNHTEILLAEDTHKLIS